MNIRGKGERLEPGDYANEYFISFADQKGNSLFQPTVRIENTAIQKGIFSRYLDLSKI